MSDFDDFSETVLTGAGDLAQELFKGCVAEAQEDSRVFLERMEVDLRRWTTALAKGELSRREFADLLDGRRALIEMFALTQIGLARTRLERFRIGLIELVIDAAFDTFLPG